MSQLVASAVAKCLLQDVVRFEQHALSLLMAMQRDQALAAVLQEYSDLRVPRGANASGRPRFDEWEISDYARPI